MHYNYLILKEQCDELKLELNIKSEYIDVLETTIDTKNKEENQIFRQDKIIMDFLQLDIQRYEEANIENVLAVEETDSSLEVNNEEVDAEYIEETDSNEIEAVQEYGSEPVYSGSVLTASSGTNYYGSQLETYYNLDMSGCIEIMRSMGNTDEYWVREDGVKMLGDYIMCAANLDIHPRGSLVETSLGTAIVVDTGGFADSNPYQIDIAVTW